MNHFENMFLCLAFTSLDCITVTRAQNKCIYRSIYDHSCITTFIRERIYVAFIFDRRTSISKNNQTNSEESGPSYIDEIPSDHHDLDMTIIDHMM